MVEGENLCHETGCPNLCCNGTTDHPVVMLLKTKAVDRYFPEAEYLDGRDLADTYPGTFRSPQGNGKELVYNSGGCIYNSASGCTAEVKPDPCGKYEFGGKKCNNLRRQAGLPEVDSEGNIIERRGVVRRLLFSR